MRILRAEHPEAVAAVVVAAHESNPFEQPRESIGGISVHGLAEPRLGYRGSLHGRCAGGPQQMAGPVDVQFSGRGDHQRRPCRGLRAGRGSRGGECTHLAPAITSWQRKLRPNASLAFSSPCTSTTVRGSRASMKETICMRSACAESPYVPNLQATGRVAWPSFSSLGPSAPRQVQQGPAGRLLVLIAGQKNGVLRVLDQRLRVSDRRSAGQHPAGRDNDAWARRQGAISLLGPRNGLDHVGVERMRALAESRGPDGETRRARASRRPHTQRGPSHRRIPALPAEFRCVGRVSE